MKAQGALSLDGKYFVFYSWESLGALGYYFAKKVKIFIFMPLTLIHKDIFFSQEAIYAFLKKLMTLFESHPERLSTASVYGRGCSATNNLIFALGMFMKAVPAVN